MEDSFGFAVGYDGRFGFNDIATQSLRDGGVQFLFRFPNGHTASIIRTPYSMMSKYKWYEGTVMITESSDPFAAFVTLPAALPDDSAVTRYLKKVNELPDVAHCTLELYDAIF